MFIGIVKVVMLLISYYVLLSCTEWKKEKKEAERIAELERIYNLCDYQKDEFWKAA